MMTHAYYGNSIGPGGDYDHFYRSNHRHMFHSGHYDRSNPYGYYEQPQRYSNRSEYPGRAGLRTLIHQPEEAANGEQRARKRISVACRRCRKRKIKCSGDSKLGLPCLACKNAGMDEAQCTFIRVGAKECSEVLLPGLEVTPVTSGISTPSTNHSIESSMPCNTGGSSMAYDGSTYQSHRQSLPTLHTRPLWGVDYDSHFDNSSMDVYGYGPGTMPRQDSFSNAYGLENYRCGNTTGSISAPTSAAYYDTIPSYSFGSLQTSSFPQAYQQHHLRLPSVVTNESFSPFHMNQLDSSLPPPPVARDRRLPIPPLPPSTPQYTGGMPPIKPFGSYTEPRLPINDIYSRNAPSFPLDAHTSRSNTRPPSIAAHAPPSGLPMSSAQHSAPALLEPMLGYQFSHPAATEGGSSSPDEVSPASGTAGGSGSFSSSSSTTPTMPPQHPPPSAIFRYPSTSAAGLYAGLPTGLAEEGSGGEDHGLGIHVAHGEADFSQHRQQQQQQQQRRFNPGGSTQRRRSSQEEQRASTAHRMSLANLNASF